MGQKDPFILNPEEAVQVRNVVQRAVRAMGILDQGGQRKMATTVLVIARQGYWRHPCGGYNEDDLLLAALLRHVSASRDAASGPSA